MHVFSTRKTTLSGLKNHDMGGIKFHYFLFV